jgi:hypothetical protein
VKVLMLDITINGEVAQVTQNKRRGLLWLGAGAGAAFLALVLWLLISQPHVALGADNQPLDCAACHKVELNFHDKLGAGNQACYVCHDATDFSAKTKNVRLVDGTIIPRSESSQLCGQCHQARYDAWKEGTHGIPGTVAAVPCVACHNPHKPQVTFQNITKPPVPPVHSAPPIPTDWLMILIITVVVLVVAGVVYARRRETT